MDFILLSPYGYMFFAFFAGIVAFLLTVKYGRHLFHLYTTQFIHRVDDKLKKSFIESSPVRLLLLSFGFTAILVFSFSIFLGVIGVLIGLVLGLLAPWFYQYLVRRKRKKQFIYQLPDALSSLAASMRAGGSLVKGIEMLALRQPEPLSQEFALIVAENRVGRELEESLESLTKRLNCKELELLTTSITIARNVGGNLADTLDILADTLREKAQIEGKIEALTATGRAQGWVISLLPFGVGVALYLQKPEAMLVLVYEPWGWVVLAVITLMMTLAVWMIYKIVNIDV